MEVLFAGSSSELEGEHLHRGHLLGRLDPHVL